MKEITKTRGGFGFAGVIISVAIVILIAGGSYFAYRRLAQNKTPQVLRSFEDCVRAGYPVVESYPRQCHAPDGKRFIEEVEEGVSASDAP